MSVKLLRRSGLVLVFGLVVAALSLSLSLAEEKPVVTAIGYSDLVRFQAQAPGVATLRVEVFDLAGKRLFDSGPAAGQALDWRMTNEQGERVAYGVYLYVTTAWDASGKMLEQRMGKLALVPGGVGLGDAPTLNPILREPSSSEASRAIPQVTYNEDLIVNGTTYTRQIQGMGEHLLIMPPSGTKLKYQTIDGGIKCEAQDKNPDKFKIYSGEQERTLFEIQAQAGGHVLFTPSGNVGIGTTNPSAALEVKGSTANLFVLKDLADNTVFRVEKDGDVYADRAYYCGLSSGCFNAGAGADVAERINMSEWVEQGDVVEIDPDHPGFFRKTRSSYSTLVAGIISTSPAITLGNSFDAKADLWKDNRPLLALAGRVPVKATTENGPIRVGDLLVSSSTPGYAMGCGDDRAACVGATIGKALEPLEEDSGTIMVQVTLR